MPLYNFNCPKHGPFRRLMTVENFKTNTHECLKCSSPVEHTGGVPTSQTMEVVGGDHARKLERLSEAERIFKEREIAHDLKYGTPSDQTEE